jgi:hypothetical protein
MEGENKDMKMKKLTALALAGVLCLGMSTTAFAAKSPVPIDSATLNGQAVPEGELINDPTDRFDDWYPGKGVDSDEASDNIKSDLQRKLNWVNTTLQNMDLDDVTIEDKEYRKQLMAEKEALEGLKLDSNVKFEVVSIADIDYTGTGTVNADTPLKIKFNLNDRNVKAGDKIHVLHEVDGSWVVFDAVVKSDADSTNPMLYIEYDMTDFSPVAIIKYTNSTDDDPTVLPPNNDPTDDPTNDPTVTPGTNGNITADQLVDLIVNRLEQRVNSVRVVRTAGQASPKTGE